MTKNEAAYVVVKTKAKEFGLCLLSKYEKATASKPESAPELEPDLVISGNDICGIPISDISVRDRIILTVRVNC